MRLQSWQLIIGAIWVFGLLTSCSSGTSEVTEAGPTPTYAGPTEVPAARPPPLPSTRGAYEQAKFLSQYASFSLIAATGDDLNGARRHAEHTINIIVGRNSGDRFGIAWGDHDGNGQAENPGDGVGVLPYTIEAIAQLDGRIESGDTPEEQKTHLNSARHCLVNLREQAKVALAQAQAVLTAADTPEATAAAQIMATAAEAGAFGVAADHNSAIDPVVGECGAEQAYEILMLNVPDLIQP